MTIKGELSFGDLVWVKFDPSIGHEYQNKRPAIVIQSNQQLKKSNLVTVVPLTSKKDNRMIDDILIEADRENNLMSDSLAKVFCISSFDYSRFEKVIGKANKDVIREIKAYLKKHFDI